MKGYVLVPLHVGSNNYCTNATLLVEILPYSVAGKEHVFRRHIPHGVHGKDFKDIRILKI